MQDRFFFVVVAFSLDYFCIFFLSVVSQLILFKFRAALGNPYWFVRRSFFVTDVFIVNSSD